MMSCILEPTSGPAEGFRFETRSKVGPSVGTVRSPAWQYLFDGTANHSLGRFVTSIGNDQSCSGEL